MFHISSKEKNKRTLLWLGGLAVVIVIGITACNIQTDKSYPFPLSKANLQKGLHQAGLNWEIVEEDSLDQGNRNFVIAQPDSHYRVSIGTMDKEGMYSLGIAVLDSLDNTQKGLDQDSERKLLQLACELSPINNYPSIRQEFANYIKLRSQKDYGAARWLHAQEDYILDMVTMEKPDDPECYVIQSISVTNQDYFVHVRQSYAKYMTQMLSSPGKMHIPVLVIQDLGTIHQKLPKQREGLTRVVVTGKLQDLRQPKQEELQGYILQDKQRPIYEKDVSIGTISNETGSLQVLIPQGYVDIGILDHETKQWHLMAHPVGDFYLVDFGLDNQEE